MVIYCPARNFVTACWEREYDDHLQELQESGVDVSGALIVETTRGGRRKLNAAKNFYETLYGNISGSDGISLTIRVNTEA